MKILQVLPELNAGGVERGTLEIARHLVANGHQSLVVSNGGRLVAQLEEEGSRHISMPVHRKSPASLLQVRPFRKLLENERPDILHIRSRVPGWIAWLAWRGLPPAARPRFVSTVHGFYSVNRYSAVMTRGERVIAVSNSVKAYILKNYPKTAAEIIRVIHRGVDDVAHHPGYQPDVAWLAEWRRAHPELEGRIPLLMPGRLTRWKGQEHFIRMIRLLLDAGKPVHGLIAGDAHPRKRAFFDELKNLAAELGVSGNITFLGHRGDLREVMAVSRIVYSLSLDPEAFGRVSIEAAALGKPVVAYDHGGVAEQLREVFPAGLVPVGDCAGAAAKTLELLESSNLPAGAGPFTCEAMCRATLEVYQELLATAGRPA
jgi:glycosyltransferase involved in cell wall biosynthesis